jgi:hypothetical protein
MRPDTQREHFRALLASIRRDIKREFFKLAEERLDTALQNFDKTYGDDTPHIVQIATNNDDLVVLLSNGQLWGFNKGEWIRVPQPPPVRK